MPNQSKTPRLRAWFGAAGLGLLAQAFTGCLYDADTRCGEGMGEFDEANNRCVCPEGSVYTEAGCVTCGEHEVASPSGCNCEEGYSRPSADAPCAETPSGLGADCDPAASTCAAPFDHCEAGSNGGYCTSSCTTSDDCEGGYACNAASICQRPPVGLGTPCETAEDCAGTEATYCDTFVAHSCQVQGCQLEPDNCFSGFECCDLTAFGVPEPLCIPQGACMQ